MNQYAVFGRPNTPWRAKGFDIIFGTETRAGQLFDSILIVCILTSVLAIMLDSVDSIQQQYRVALTRIEWAFTLLFTLEYLARLICVDRPVRYLFSFYGLIDLLAVVPTYIGLFGQNGQYYLIIRVLRVLRIFRVLKLAHYLGEANILVIALKGSRRKIVVFLFTVTTIVVIFGSLMYLLEGKENGFSSIPMSIYWAIVTITTVGYGDIYPQTDMGRALAACTMIIGYAIIAVPTGIFTAELTHAIRTRKEDTICPKCAYQAHDMDAIYCKKCGSAL